VESSNASGQRVFVYDAFGNLAAEYSTVAPGALGTQYLTVDHLGSTRLVVNTYGNVERHDYQPFGSEILGSEAGWRSSVSGYGIDSGIRQKFTGQERDTESTLDFLQARYLSSPQGRFTSADPGNAGANPADPQSWNGYAYVNNNPLANTDPDGLDGGGFGGFGGFGLPPIFGGSGGSGSFPGIGTPPSAGPGTQAWPGTLAGCGGPFGTFGGGVGSCPFIFSATGQGGIYDATISATPLPTGGPLDIFLGPVKSTLAGLIYLMNLGNPTSMSQRAIDSLELSTRLQKNGDIAYATVGMVTGIGQLHHIATNKNLAGGFTAAFERLFARAGMTLNDDENLVRLVGHAGRHAPEYHQMVLDKLTAATMGLRGAEFKAALIQELRAIRQILEKDISILK
jgi:RHS repeat-associated protein